MTRIDELLQEIRPLWMKKASARLARGEGVREMFVEELERFYALMQQSVEYGDPAWMDGLLSGWINARTLTDIEERDASMLPLVNDLLMITVESVQDNLPGEDALTVLRALLPVFMHCMEFTSRQEANENIQRISDELERANNALERLDKSKSDFIAVAAHELKTPLTLIEGYSSMLADILPADLRKSQADIFLSGIGGGSRRLKEIVDDMIDVSMIDNNLLSIRFQPVWLLHIFSSLDREFDELAKERNIKVRFHRFQGCDEMTFGDGERLTQAFRNLIANAVKFTPDGGKITVDGRLLPGFIEVTVSDTGIGINPEDQTHIFEKFGRLGNASLHSSSKTKFKGGGPGLGLPITKGIFEAHGGAIWVESPGYDEVNCPGSTFHVLMPIYKECPDSKTRKLFQPLSEIIPEKSS